MHLLRTILLLPLCVAICQCTDPMNSMAQRHTMNGLQLDYPLNDAQKALQQQRIELYRQQLQRHQQRQQHGLESLSSSIAIEAELVRLQLQMTTDAPTQRALLQQLQQTYQKVITEQQAKVALNALDPDVLAASQSALLELNMLELQLR